MDRPNPTITSIIRFYAGAPDSGPSSLIDGNLAVAIPTVPVESRFGAAGEFPELDLLPGEKPLEDPAKYIQGSLGPVDQLPRSIEEAIRPRTHADRRESILQSSKPEQTFLMGIVGCVREILDIQTLFASNAAKYIQAEAVSNILKAERRIWNAIQNGDKNALRQINWVFTHIAKLNKLYNRLPEEIRETPLAIRRICEDALLYTLEANTLSPEQRAALNKALTLAVAPPIKLTPAQEAEIKQILDAPEDRYHNAQCPITFEQMRIARSAFRLPPSPKPPKSSAPAL